MSAIRAIMERPRYSEARWSLRVIDVKSGEAVVLQVSNADKFVGERL